MSAKVGVVGGRKRTYERLRRNAEETTMNAVYSVNLRHIALYPKDCVCKVAAETGSEAFSIIALFMNGIRLRADASGAIGDYHSGHTPWSTSDCPQEP